MTLSLTDEIQSLKFLAQFDKYRHHAQSYCMLLRLTKSTLSNAADAFWPPVCSVCATATTHHHTLCPQCWANMKFITAPYCEKLGIPLSAELPSGSFSLEALSHTTHFEKVRAAVIFNEISKKLIHKLKYSDRLECTQFIASHMAQAGTELLQTTDLIVPMPLHFIRLWSRKYNQSEKLAHLIAKKSLKPINTSALYRSKYTTAQVGKTKSQRQKNVQNAFRVREKYIPLIIGKNILLVDDVYTTGATANSAAKCLLQAGAACVNILTFAIVTNTLE